MNPTTKAESPIPTPAPASAPNWAGLALLHGGVPAWLGYGAIVKAIELNPQLLPSPILKTLTKVATSLPGDAAAFLDSALRAIVGVEVFLALAILLSTRYARLLATLTMSLFCAILLYAIVETGFKDGWVKAMTGSCGCFGEKGLPATVMLAVDAILLASALFLVPKNRRGSIVALIPAAVVGAAVAIFAPEPQVTVVVPPSTQPSEEPKTAEAQDGPSALSPSTPADATAAPAPAPAPVDGIGSPWPPAPAKYERIYFPKFKEWVGKPFRDQKLALAIERPMPDDLEKGDWIVTFSRPDCDRCQEFYFDHFSEPRTERVLKVSINDSTGTKLRMDCVGCVERSVYRLPPGETGKSPEYLLQTPCAIRLKNGVVVAVCTDVDNAEELASVLSPIVAEPAAVTPPSVPQSVPLPAKTAWPGLPEKIERTYLPEFPKMVGQKFAEIPFARLIAGSVPAEFLTGRWILVYYREDCDHCHTLLMSYFTGKLPVRTATIAIPDADPNNLMENPCDECVKLSLVKGPNYIVGTPIVIALQDGVVECVVDNVDDMASLEACLKFPN
jgi:hypothetical protein